MKKSAGNIGLKAWSVLMIVFALFISTGLQAQQNKWKGWGSPELGYISGSYEPSADIRLQGGLQKNGWLVGLGAGVDYYRFTSFPIYAQGRKMIGKRKGKPFILASMGINIPSASINKQQNPQIDFLSSFRAPDTVPNEYDMGIYAEAGAGYAFLNKKGRGLMLSLSYTQKRIKESGTNYYYMTQGMGGPSDEINEYIMNRAAVRIGYLF
jgi:hypothetical protein